MTGLLTAAAPARPTTVTPGDLAVATVSLRTHVTRLTPVVLRNTGRAELAGGLIATGLLMRFAGRRRLV